jgi:hypothetical protein
MRVYRRRSIPIPSTVLPTPSTLHMRVYRRRSIPIPSPPTLAAGICRPSFDQHRLMKLLPALRPIIGDLAGRDLNQRTPHGSPHIGQ